MKIWIDLANSPHVPLFEPLADELEARGHELVLTLRDHAQTVALAQTRWPEARVVGGESPPGRLAKTATLLRRAQDLRRLARSVRPDVALSHGSYAQVVAARSAGVPAVTMMDYEYQPANHLSFRLANRVVVPEVFPARELRRCGARPGKVLRYPGYKEELYLAGFRPDRSVLAELGLAGDSVVVVMRPPPEGALYHRDANDRFDELLERARAQAGVTVVLLPRTRDQHARYEDVDGVVVPAHPIDGRSLLACADVAIGAGGTMNREAALLGTPTYTVFAGRLAAVDRALIDAGLLFDLRDPATTPAFTPRGADAAPPPPVRRAQITEVVVRALDEAVA